MEGKTATKLTDADIDAAIVDEAFHVFEGTTLTVCCLYLVNGYTVTGESACVNPVNFDPETGRVLARQKAREKIWQLEGYRLQQQIHEGR